MLDTAAAELGTAGPDADPDEAAHRYEQWKILYLALVAGLRYNEIDRLCVQDVAPDDGRISIRTHETFRPKTQASEGDVLVAPAAAAVLREMIKRTEGQWFIKDGVSKRSRSYRAGSHHDALVSGCATTRKGEPNRSQTCPSPSTNCARRPGRWSTASTA